MITREWFRKYFQRMEFAQTTDEKIAYEEHITNEVMEAISTIEQERDAARATLAQRDAEIAEHRRHVATVMQREDEQRKRADNLTRLAKSLIEKMEKIYESPEYQGVWLSATIHGEGYEGEKWEDEFNALKAALAAQPDQKGA